MRASLLILVSAIGAAALAQPSSAEHTKLAKLEQAYKTSKVSFTKKPKDPKVRKAYVAATVSFGTATMLAGSLPPCQKYPTALRLYREALKVDPKNKEALDNKKQIESIYESMGKPIPK